MVYWKGGGAKCDLDEKTTCRRRCKKLEDGEGTFLVHMQGFLSCVARRGEMVRKKMKRKMNLLSR